MSSLNLNICIDSIDSSKVFTSEKTGKRYLSLSITQLREVGKFGDTHAVAYSKSKEEVANKAATVYVKDASAKEFFFKNEQ